MFKNWKLLLISILLCSDSLSLSMESGTIIKGVKTNEEKEEQLKDKIAPVINTFYQYIKSADQDTKLKKEGELLVYVQALGSEVIKADNKADKLLEELGGLKKDLRFHLKVSSSLVDREILIDYFDKYVGWVSFKLKGGPAIKAAYEIFLRNPELSNNSTIIEESKRFKKFLDDNNISIDEFIEMQADAYHQISEYVRLFKQYCRTGLTPDTCELIIRMAPDIGQPMHSILEYMFERIPADKKQRKKCTDIAPAKQYKTQQKTKPMKPYRKRRN